jgi:hypothetical protein
MLRPLSRLAENAPVQASEVLFQTEHSIGSAECKTILVFIYSAIFIFMSFGFLVSTS